MRRGWVRKSELASVWGLLVSIVFTIGGPIAAFANGAIGVGVWFLLAGGAMIVYNAYGVFSGRGAPKWGEFVELPDESREDSSPFPRPTRSSEEFERRLRALMRLRADGLISDAEYTAKRDEIMGTRW